MKRPVQRPKVRFNACRLGVSLIGGGLPLCFFWASVQPRLRSLYLYTMCKPIAKPVARTVGASSEPPLMVELLERHRPAGGTATPAGVPIG